MTSALGKPPRRGRARAASSQATPSPPRTLRAWCCTPRRASRRRGGRPGAGPRRTPASDPQRDSALLERARRQPVLGQREVGWLGRRLHREAAPAGSPRTPRIASSAPRSRFPAPRSRRPTSRGRRPAITRPSERTSSAARVLASGTGPRRPAREIVVASVISPERSIAAARAVRPSSHGVEKTKWSFEEIAASPQSRAASTASITRRAGLALVPELHQGQVYADLHGADRSRLRNPSDHQAILHGACFRVLRRGMPEEDSNPRHADYDSAALTS